MTTASKIGWGVDLYRAVIFPLTGTGLFQPVDENVYEGLQFEGSRVFEITPAESREVVNYGDGRVRDTIYLPPNTATKGELRVGYEHQDLNAALTSVKTFTIGEGTFIPMSTDQQGTEPVVSMLLMQQAKDVNKNKFWRSYLIPRAQCIPMPPSFNENATEIRYQITMNPSTVLPWNTALTEADHGCLEMAYASANTEGRPNIVSFLADGIAVAFLFPASKQALAAGKIAVYNGTTGVEITAGITKATTGVTFGVAPVIGTILVFKYEY